MGAMLPQHSHSRIGGTAAAANQGLLALHVNSGVSQHGLEAKIIRIVPNESSVRLTDDGIHGSQPLCTVRQLVQKGDHIFFIGNGHVQSRKIAIFQKILQRLRLFFKERIAVGAKHGMNLGRIAVAKLSAKQTALHQTTSVKLPRYLNSSQKSSSSQISCTNSSE